MKHGMQLQGKWLGPTEEEKRAFAAVIEYDARCDAYDILVCGKDGMPRSDEQRYLVNRNARTTRLEVVEKHNISTDQFDKEIRCQDR